VETKWRRHGARFVSAEMRRAKERFDHPHRAAQMRRLLLPMRGALKNL
jgi:hypothetical protein